jgi:hypothetical protein
MVCANALAVCKQNAAKVVSQGGRSMAFEYCQKQYTDCMTPPVPGGGDQMDVAEPAPAPPAPAPATPTIPTFAECGGMYTICKRVSKTPQTLATCDTNFDACKKLAGQADRPQPENGYIAPPPPDGQLAKPSFAAQYLTPTNMALAAGGAVVGWLLKGWGGAAVGAVALPACNILYQRLKKPAALKTAPLPRYLQPHESDYIQ